jgi:hypothetical protein
VYLSINEIRNHARDGDTVRAIVLLSDGDYNWYGDPLARGHSSHDDPDSYDDLDSDYYRFSGLGSGKFSDQNMSVYARNNNIKIFSIGYADELSAGGRNTLAILARGTGGKYYNGSAGNIADVYRAIAGELKEDAGVNTTMDLHFQTIHVNDGTFPGEEVFEYQYVPGISTYEKSYNATLDPWPGTAKWYDQTDEWDTGKNLHFDVGTIHQGQTWEVTLRMRVLKEGNINVIGPGSFISFNNGESMVGLPDTYVTATANLTPSPSGEPTLVIERPPGLVNTNNATLVEFLYLNWWVTYDGEMTYTETLTYQYRDPATWVWGPEKSLDGLAPKGNGTWINGNTALYLPTLYPGEYIIHLRAIAQDGARDEISLPVTLGTNKPYIILK